MYSRKNVPVLVVFWGRSSMLCTPSTPQRVSRRALPALPWSIRQLGRPEVCVIAYSRQAARANNTTRGYSLALSSTPSLTGTLVWRSPCELCSLLLTNPWPPSPCLRESQIQGANRLPLNSPRELLFLYPLQVPKVEGVPGMTRMQKVMAGRVSSRSSIRYVASCWRESIHLLWYFCNESLKAQCSPEMGWLLGI